MIEEDPLIDCDECHGHGFFTCEEGCHNQTCDRCEGSGKIPESERGV